MYSKVLSLFLRVLLLGCGLLSLFGLRKTFLELLLCLRLRLFKTLHLKHVQETSTLGVIHPLHQLAVGLLVLHKILHLFSHISLLLAQLDVDFARLLLYSSVLLISRAAPLLGSLDGGKQVSVDSLIVHADGSGALGLLCLFLLNGELEV